MALPSGRYIITNCHTRNIVVLRDDNKDSPLRGRVHGLHDERRGEEWNVVALDNGNYKIQNIDFDSQFAGYNPGPTEGDEVLGKSKAHEWRITQPFTKSSACLISPSSNKDLFWGLPMDGDGTPVAMFSIPTDPRNHWLFKLIDQDPPLDLGPVPSAPLEETSGQTTQNRRPVLKFLWVMSLLGRLAML